MEKLCMNKRIRRKKQKQLQQECERKLKSLSLWPPKLDLEVPIFPDYNLLALCRGIVTPPTPTLQIDHL